MKYLLLLLFLISFKTFALSHTEIDALQIEVYAPELTYRIDNDCPYNYYIPPVDETPVPQPTITPLNWYDNLTTTASDCLKPELSAIESEFVEYKTELHTAETIREKKVEIWNRYQVIQFYKWDIIAALGVNTDNPDKWIKDKIRAVDTIAKADAGLALITEWEGEIAAIQAAELAAATIETDCASYLVNLKGSLTSLDQIETYIENNVTDLASAKLHLIRLTKLAYCKTLRSL